MTTTMNNPQLPTAPLPLVQAPLSGLRTAASVASASPPQQPADLSKKAESLQQRIEHIDKVISQNQAIVDVVDPIWQRRYMRQNSKEGATAADDKLARGKARPAAPPTSTAAVVALTAPAISASPPTAALSLTPAGATSAMAAKPISIQQHHLQQQQQQQQPQQPPVPIQVPLPLTIRHPLPQAPDPAGGVHAVALIKPEMLRLSSAAAPTPLAPGSR